MTLPGSYDIVEKIFDFENQKDNDLKNEIASDPIRICLCKNGQPNCNVTNHTLEIL